MIYSPHHNQINVQLIRCLVGNPALPQALSVVRLGCHDGLGSEKPV